MALEPVPAMPPLVVIAHDDAGTADSLRHAVEAAGGWQVAVVDASPAGMAAALAGGPSVALVGCAVLASLPPGCRTPIVAIGDDNRAADVHAALAAGARSLLLWPDGAADLAGELARVAATGRTYADESGGLVVAARGVQGGAGTTTVAIHLAAAWARWGPAPVLLLDLAGGLGFRLDLGTAPTWATVAPAIGTPLDNTGQGAPAAGTAVSGTTQDGGARADTATGRSRAGGGRLGAVAGRSPDTTPPVGAVAGSAPDARVGAAAGLDLGAETGLPFGTETAFQVGAETGFQVGAETGFQVGAETGLSLLAPGALPGVVAEPWPGLAVVPLAGLADGVPDPPPEPWAVQAVLEAARATYRLVVVDLPATGGPAVQAALSQTDALLTVGRCETAGVRGLQAALAAWTAAGRDPDSAGAVVTGVRPQAPLAPREVRATLGDRLWGLIPAAASELAAAAEDGVLLLDRHDLPAVQAMVTLANRVVPFATVSA